MRLASPPAHVELEVARRTACLQHRTDPRSVGAVNEHVDLLERPPEDRVPLPPEEREPGGVHFEDAVVLEAADQHRVRARAEDPGEELARLAQLRFGLLLRGDVAADTAVAAEAAGRVEHRLAARQAIAHPAVGGAPDDQEVAERLVRFAPPHMLRPRGRIALLVRELPAPLAEVPGRIEARRRPETG